MFFFSQPSSGLHNCGGLFGIGLTLCRLCKLWCLWLSVWVCKNLHEEHVLCQHACCCKCLIWNHHCIVMSVFFVLISFFSPGCLLVSITDRLLQPSDWSVNDSAGHVHGNVWHRQPKGFAAMSFFTQENWWWDELWFPHGSSHGFGPPLLGRRQVRFVLKYFSVVFPEPTTGVNSSIWSNKHLCNYI